MKNNGDLKTSIFVFMFVFSIFFDLIVDLSRHHNIDFRIWILFDDCGEIRI